MNYSLEVLTPCRCNGGRSWLTRVWYSALSIRVECGNCGRKGPLADGVTMAEAKIKSHQLWNQQAEKEGEPGVRVGSEPQA